MPNLTSLSAQSLKHLTQAPVENLHATAIPNLFIFHLEKGGEDITYLQESGVCLILQGSKSVRTGGQHYRYAAGEFVCYTVDIPIVSQYHTPDKQPYIDLRLVFDLPLMREVIDDLNRQNFCFPPARKQKIVSPISTNLARCFEHLLALLDTPQDIPIMLPWVKKAIYYYLLKSEQGSILWQLALQDSNTARIASSIDWLKRHYAETVNMERLAAQTGMSVSGFYTHFRNQTGISPLQYQKNLRLIEAKRLIKQNKWKITEIAYQVGYESPSQFGREYKRQFGYPPSRESE